MDADLRSLQAVRRRYNEIETIWDAQDRWHEIARREISSAIRDLTAARPEPYRLVVDVGSGGLPQQVSSEAYLQADLADARLRGQPFACCADAHRLPLPAGVADCVLCVGSVANYCALAELVAELARIAAPRAAMVLHVELTNSLEFLFRPTARADAAQVMTHYQSGLEATWCYSLDYTCKSVERSGFAITARRFFHTASALAFRCGVSPRLASYLAVLDPLLRHVPGTANYADSVILTCVRND